MNSIDRNWVDNHIDSNGEVVIPEGIEKVEPMAFAGNEKVRKIVIPDTVTEIGDKAFALCPNLEEVQFGNGIKSIGDSAFSRCKSLSNIDLPTQLEHLGRCAFRNCSQLKSITLGDFIKNIEPLTFDGSGIEQIKLPSSLEKIDIRAFSNCSQLKTVEGGFNITGIEAGAFENTAITSFQIPNNIISIRATAFRGNSNLSSVTLNGNLDFLSERAFDKCDNLNEIIINGTQRINYGAFMNKANVRKITIDGQEINLDENEQLFSLQKVGEKVAVVVQDEKGKFSTKALNLEKGTRNVISNNVYLNDNGKLCYAINSLADISLKRLESLKQQGQSRLYIYGGDNEITPTEHEKGLNFNLYNIEDLIQIKTKIQELKKQITIPNQQDKHREKKIYGQIIRMLSENIEYDYWGAGVSKEKYERMTGKSYDDYVRVNKNRDPNITHLEDRNLVGLLRGMAVCQGNAEIIRNIAAEFGIEAKSIRGKNHEGEGHEWNQIKLDDVWYDDDFTYYQTSLSLGQFDKCVAFLMGTEGNVPFTKYAGYVPYTETHNVGKPFKMADKKFLLNYGRDRQQPKQQTVQETEKMHQQDQSIKDEVGDEFKTKTQEEKQNEQDAQTLWMNRLQECDKTVDKMPEGAKKKQEVVKLIQILDNQRNRMQNEQMQGDAQNPVQR